MAQPLEFEKPLVELENKVQELKTFSEQKGLDLTEEIATLEKKSHSLKEAIFGNLTPWQKTQIARHPERPNYYDYIQLLFEDFIELHGDRAFAEDRAIAGGVAFFKGIPVTIIGNVKGRDTKENLRRNFAQAHPEGYRKALRLMKQAEKFGRPVITLIDTPGAYSGLTAEERGQAGAIAQNLLAMSGLRVPVISVVIGEGGSGGALALGMGNKVLMLEHSFYSVITPESCATILWKDSTKAIEAAEALKYTAQDLLRLEVIDEIIAEPLGGAHRNRSETAAKLGEVLERYLLELRELSAQQLLQQRYDKFRKMGVLA